MKEIKNEVQKLLELLESIKQTQNDFIDYEINKMISDTAGSDSISNDSTDYLSDSFKIIIASKGNQNLHQFQKDLFRQYQTILDITINLNQLLEEPIKKVQSIEELKQKTMLSIKEVEVIYGFSKSSQQGFRGRLKNSLPHHKSSTKSKSANTKVYYKRKELDDWIANFL